MKNKKLILSVVSILSILFLISVVSAAVTFVNVTNNGSSVQQGGSVVISFKTQESGTSNLTNISFNTPIAMTSGVNTFNSSSTITNAITVLDESTISGVMSLTFNIPSAQAVGSYAGTLTLTGTYTNTMSYNLPITLTVTPSTTTDEVPAEIKACSSIGNPNNNLRIRDIDISNEGISAVRYGNNDQWFPLENINVRIEIENKGDDRIDNIEVNWGLYDRRSKEWVIELDDEKDFDLRKDKNKVLDISFNLEKDLDVDLEDLTDGDNYLFYVTAEGFDRETDADVCTNRSEEIGVAIESDFVVLDNLQIPSTVSCGTDLQIIADVWNIGDSDQEEVYVRIFNNELKIDKRADIGDVNSFDHEDLNTIITIPENAQERKYTLSFEVYDEDDDVFITDFDDDKSKLNTLLEVKGNCIGESPKVVVSASVDSGGRAGEELVVKANVINTGTKLTTFSITAEGYSGWSDSVDISPGTVLIDKGASTEVLFKFNVKEDASGDQTFTLRLTSGGSIVLEQPFSVSIEGKESGRGFGAFGGLFSDGNAYLWGIGLLNIILVIVIIIVAVKVAKK